MPRKAAGQKEGRAKQRRANPGRWKKKNSFFGPEIDRIPAPLLSPPSFFEGAFDTIWVFGKSTPNDRPGFVRSVVRHIPADRNSVTGSANWSDLAYVVSSLKKNGRRFELLTYSAIQLEHWSRVDSVTEQRGYLGSLQITTLAINLSFGGFH